MKIKNEREIPSNLLDIKQTAAYLHLPIYTVNQYIRQDKLRYISKSVQKHYYFKKEYLDEYIKQCDLLNNLFTLDQTIEYVNTSRNSLQCWEKLTN